MNEFEGLSDYLIQEEPERFLRKISANASESSLWVRTPQGKAIAIRATSMIPQFKVTSEALEVMWTVGAGVESRNTLTGFLVGHKYSPKHYLSVKLSECQWHASRAARPQGDYCIPLFPKRLDSPAAELLDLDSHEFEALLAAVQGSLDNTRDDECLEPLDLCKAVIAFSIDRANQMLFMKCELLHPAVSLHFTPIQPLKLVSTPLSTQLIQEVKGRKGKFQTGFLTLDQGKRVLPMLVSDPMAYKCVLVGMWVSGIPMPSQLPDNGRYNALTHPLVWSSAVRYLQSGSIKDRVSPCPDQNTFLFVHFSASTKFYEVSTLDEPMWKTCESCHEVARERGDYLQPTIISFLRDGNTSVQSNMSSVYESSFSSSCSNPAIEEHLPAVLTALPVITRQSTNHESLGSSVSSRSKPPKPEVRESRESSESGVKTSLQEHDRVLKRLQQQVSELQEYMQKYQPYMNTPVQTEKQVVSTSVNTTLKPESPKRQYWLHRFATTATNTSFNVEAKVDADMVKTVKRQVEERTCDDDFSYNPMRYSSSSANMTLDSPQTSAGSETYPPPLTVADSQVVLPHDLPKQRKEMSTSSSAVGLSQVSVCGSKTQITQYQAPVKPREHVIEGHSGGDETITIPKIAFSHEDLGSDDEEDDEEEAIQKVQRKYILK